MRFIKWGAGGFAALMLLAFLSVLNSGPAGYPLDQRLIVWYLSLPNFVFEWQLQNEPETIDGQVLHPKMQYLFEQTRSPEASKKYEAMLRDPEGLMEFRELVDVHWPLRTKVTRPMAEQKDIMIPGAEGEIRARMYRPHTNVQGPLPVLLYFHGGAYLFGSVEAVDLYTRLIANEADVLVVSIDYRLAPENPFPAPMDDALAAYDWLLANVEQLGGDPARIAVGGDSAGGGLSLYITRDAIENGGRVPDYQLLYYPSVNADMSYPSNKLFGDGYGLDKWMIDTAIEGMFPGGVDLSDPRIDVLQFGRTSEMPATYVSSAGFDPLRDSIVALVQKLQKAGVDVMYEHYPTLAHNYLEHSATIDDAETAAERSAHIFRRYMHAEK